MKKLLLLFMPVFFLLAFTSCSDSNDDGEDDGADAVIELTPADRLPEFYIEGGIEILKVKSSQAWTITSDKDWCTVDPISGDASETGIEVKVTTTANNEGKTRQATLTVNSRNTGKTVTARQNITASDITALMDDEVFKAYCLANFDEDGNGKISNKEAASVSKLNIPELNISSLKGIEKFVILDTIICNNNNLKTIDITTLQFLKYVDCSDNVITAIDPTNCGNLTTLICNNNQLQELNTSGNSMLKRLECRNNLLPYIDINNNQSIEYIDCLDNAALEYIFVWLGFDADDEKYTILKPEHTMIRGAKPDSFVVTPESPLEFIFRGGEKTINIYTITDWTLKITNKPEWLTIEGLDENGQLKGSQDGVVKLSATANEENTDKTATLTITSDGRGLEPMDITVTLRRKATPALTFTKLAPAADPYLELSEKNDTVRLDVKSTVGWTVTADPEVDWFTTPNATDDGNKTILFIGAADSRFEDSWESTKITVAPSDPEDASLSSYTFTLYRSKDITPHLAESFANLLVDNVTNNPNKTVTGFVGDERISAREANSAGKMTFYNNSDLKSIGGIEYFTGLSEISITNCDITGSVDVSTIKGLTKLSLSKNPNLSNVNISGLYDLSTIDLETTGVSGLDINGLVDPETGVSALTSLKISGTAEKYVPITSLDLTKVPNLATLTLKYTNLASLSIDGTNLTGTLTLSNNKLSQFSLKNNGNIATLELENNLLTDDGFSIEKLAKLKTIKLANNSLTTISMITDNIAADNCPIIESISVNNNGITGVDLSSFPTVKSLFVLDCPIENINMGGELTQLHINSSAVSNAAKMTGGAKLGTLHIKDKSDLSSIVLGSYPKLKTLVLSNLGLTSLTPPVTTEKLDLNLTGNKQLTSLSFTDGSNITKLNLTDCEKLTNLNLTNINSANTCTLILTNTGITSSDNITWSSNIYNVEYDGGETGGKLTKLSFDNTGNEAGTSTSGLYVTCKGKLLFSTITGKNITSLTLTDANLNGSTSFSFKNIGTNTGTGKTLSANLTGTGLTSISDLEYVTTLTYNTCKLTSLDLTNVAKERTANASITCKGIADASTITLGPKVSSLQIQGSSAVKKEATIGTLSLAGAGTTGCDLTVHVGYTEVSGVTNITPKLKSLNVTNAAISGALDLSMCNILTTAALENNNITSIDLSAATTALTSLKFKGNDNFTKLRIPEAVYNAAKAKATFPANFNEGTMVEFVTAP